MQSEHNAFSLSVGDLMTAMLLIFILLFSAILLNMEKLFGVSANQAESVRQMTVVYDETKSAIVNALEEELGNDMREKWNATLDPDSLTIRFLNRGDMFERGEAALQPNFQDILNDFFPRYISILHDRFQPSIKEIRIEGHTSSEWLEGMDPLDAYFFNMELSQRRTRAVLEYGLTGLRRTHPAMLEWARLNITANGLSSSKLRYRNDERKEEDKILSRRVEFRIRTNTEELIDDIRRELRGNS